MARKLLQQARFNDIDHGGVHRCRIDGAATTAAAIVRYAATRRPAADYPILAITGADNLKESKLSNYQPLDVKLLDAVEWIEEGRLQLPDFQRNFKWSRSQQAGLLDSIQKRYPTGTLLLLELSPEGDQPFGARPFSGIETVSEPARYIVLDGQQRLTSCFMALSGMNTFWFAIDVWKLFQTTGGKGGQPVDFEDHLIPVRPTNHPESLLYNRNLLPLQLLRDKETLRDRIRQYRKNLEQNPETEDFGAFVESRLELYLDPIFNYGFPAVVLPASLDIETVANIFTKINTTGLRLSAFDLCVAALFPQGVNLRAMWEDARATREIAAFDSDGTNLLQATALLASKPPKKASLVKTLTKTDVDGHWHRAVEGITTAAGYLEKVGILSPKTLPYDALVPALAAALVNASHIPASQPQKKSERIRKIQRWVIQTAMLQRYNEGTDVKQAEDTPLILAWLGGGTTPPFLEDEVYWQESITHMGRSGARAKSVLAMLNERGPRDLVNTSTHLTTANSELHHIFPKAYLLANGHEAKAADRALNISLLTKDSNNFISDRAPSTYLRDRIDEIMKLGGSEGDATATLADTLWGHLISPVAMNAMLDDDYESFLQARAESVQQYMTSLGIAVIKAETASEDDLVDDEEDDDNSD